MRRNQWKRISTRRRRRRRWARSDLDGMAPTPIRRRLANDSALTASLQSGCCIFFQFFDYAINNAYLLYKNSCHAHKLSAKDLLGFRLELVHLLFEQAGPKSVVVRAYKVATDAAKSVRVCVT